MDYLTSEKIQDLRKLAKQNTGVAAFIGAGCSAVLKIPLWDELLVGLNLEFNYYSSKEAVLEAIKVDGYPKWLPILQSGCIGDLFKRAVLEMFQGDRRYGMDERKAILAEIERQEMMLSNARKQIAANEIEPDDFKAIKADCNKALMLLEDKLSGLPTKGDSLKTIESLLDILILKFSDIQMYFKRSSIVEKRKLIGSMYPQNLCFDGIGHRTPYLSEPLSLMLQITSSYKA